MKKIGILLLLGVFFFSLGAYFYGTAQQETNLDAVLYQNIPAEDKPLRLHVLANSDDAYDQQIKLAIRDRVLEILEDPLAKCTSKEEAISLLNQALPEIERVCDEWLSQSGVSYRSCARIERTEFPAIAYDETVFAAGEYDALRIVLGSGQGHNWWCVLFPPLCFVDVVAKVDDSAIVPASTGEKNIIDGYRIDFKINQLLDIAK